MNRNNNFKDRIPKEKNIPVFCGGNRNNMIPGVVFDRFGMFLASPGNAQVARLFAGGQIQAKLDMSAPEDFYEQQADKIAGQMIRTKSGTEPRNFNVNKVQAKGNGSGMQIIKFKMMICLPVRKTSRFITMTPIRLSIPTKS